MWGSGGTRGTWGNEGGYGERRYWGARGNEGYREEWGVYRAVWGGEVGWAV